VNGRPSIVSNVKISNNLDEIIRGCVRNERKSQSDLFKLFYGRMLAVCMRYISDRDSAQDVVQEGFIKIFNKVNVFDFKGSFEGWMRRIFVNTAIDSIRRNKKDVFLTDNDNDFKMQAVDFIVDFESDQATELKAEIALKAIQKLSPAYRTVFNLYVMEEYSHREIAEILGISEGTSKSNLAKAKANLQKRLNEQFLNIE
jgi:RNA polymerase sigma factor (sigma-70 family)